VGHKRFSLEGGEALVPVLDRLLDHAAELEIAEVVMGMAHRGRLNVLTQTLGVDPARIFAQFQGDPDPDVTQGSGDVKYHLGATGTHRTAAGAEVRMVLSPNPSHLEAVDPVVEGIARAKQERMGAEAGRRRILPLLIHGDAAFAGQGVVAETLNLSQLRGYRTGGTVHVIVNNQIGFTTPVESARSSPYPTDVAKMCQAPVFHVNGDDPEAAVRALGWALDFRQTFQKDVVLDIVCYRRHGHNEGDEPGYTQPRLYAAIRNHPSPATIYRERLVREGAVTAEEAAALERAAGERLEASFRRSREPGVDFTPAPIVAPERERAASRVRETAVPRSVLETVTRGLLSVPEGLDVHPKLHKGMEARRVVLDTGQGVDWAFAEALAWGSLVLGGVPVRLSGQDSVRGTFSQRHLLLHDDDTTMNWMALQHLDPEQAPFAAVDSPLSEEAVLGFEFGFTIGDPDTLVLWEAQFGDFVNEAQVVIDQFLAGSHSKWGQPSGLVLLLPHGYEGQGPDHSSARLERFLQLAAEDNLQVVNVTTPAQYFHRLRGQAGRRTAAPLVILTPKSLLRHPRAVSAVEELTAGGFRPVLDDPLAGSLADVRRIVFCSGKVYYDLEAAREASGSAAAAPDVALIRVEELYPFPEREIRRVLARHPRAERVWVQEEPRNMGAWTFMADRFRRLDPAETLRYVGRPESASTATGYHSIHDAEQRRLVMEALGG
jgi:2-oxoglutarate dehydrogenase E1 component